MNTKVFSAQSIVSQKDSFEKVEKISRGENEIFVIGGFADPVDPAVKKIFQKATKIFKENFAEKEGSALEKFEECLKDLNDETRESAAKIEKGVWLSGGIAVGIFDGADLHFSLCGGVEVYFLRAGNFATISDGLFDPSKFKDLFANVASGDLQNGDKIIFSTVRLLRFATGKQIAAQSSGGVLEAAESLEFILPEETAAGILIFGVKNLQVLPFANGTKSFSKFAKFATGKLAKFKGVEQFFQKAAEWFSKNFSARDRQKKTALVLAGSLAGLLALIFFVSISARRGDENLLNYAAAIDEIRQDLVNCENRRLEGKTDEANLLLARVEKRAGEINEAGFFRSEILEILEEAQKMKDAVNKITRISGAKVLADLTGTSQTLRGIFEFDGEIFAFDKNNLFEILQASGEVKNNFKITTDDEIVDAAPFETKREIIFLAKSGKIVEFQNGQIDFATTSDEAFKSAIDLATFSKYLYLLDPPSNQIWKYERKDRGFTGASDYNLDGDLAGGKSFAIDGAIYILKPESGAIEKIYRGKRESFRLKNIPAEEISKTSKIVTNEDLSKFYILDNSQRRILVFQKTENEAIYDRQIVIEDLPEIRDFWINAKTNRLFFAGDLKIYEIGL